MFISVTCCVEIQIIVCSGTFNYRGIIHGSHSCKQGRSLVAKIVFKYGVSTMSNKDRVWKLKCNCLGKYPCLSFKDKAHWCWVSICEGYGWGLKGVASKDGHFKE